MWEILTVSSSSCIVVVCFLQLNCFLKCFCSPFAFTREMTYCCICSHCHIRFLFNPPPPHTDCSSKCLSPKGLPLVVCRVQGIAIAARKARLVRAHAERKTPEDPADAPHKRVAFSQQHSQWKQEGEPWSPPLALRRMCYFGSMQYSLSSLPSSLKPDLCSSFCKYLIWQEEKSPLNQTEVPPSHGRWHDAHTHISTLFLLRLSRSLLSLQEVRRHTSSHSLRVNWGWGQVWVRESVSQCNVQLSACESQTHCVSSVPIKSVL